MTLPVNSREPYIHTVDPRYERHVWQSTVCAYQAGALPPGLVGTKVSLGRFWCVVESVRLPTQGRCFAGSRVAGMLVCGNWHLANPAFALTGGPTW